MPSLKGPLENNAEQIARTVHHSETYNGAPYSRHLEEVVSETRSLIELAETYSIALTADEKDLLLAGAWLHDSMETSIDQGQEAETSCNSAIEKLSPTLLKLVEAVTRRKPGTPEQWFEKTSQTPGAAIVKAADRIANLRAIHQDLLKNPDPSMQAKAQKLIRKYTHEQQILEHCLKSAKLLGSTSSESAQSYTLKLSETIRSYLET